MLRIPDCVGGASLATLHGGSSEDFRGLRLLILRLGAVLRDKTLGKAGKYQHSPEEEIHCSEGEEDW